MSRTLELAPASRELWRDLCDGDPSCTFYQTPGWVETTGAYLKAAPAPFLLTLGNKRAVLPLLRSRRRLFPLYYSPFGTYSGLVSPEKWTPQELGAAGEGLSRFNMNLVANPFSQNALKMGRISRHFVQVIDLGKLPADDVTGAWEEGQRRRVRVALKKGVRIRCAESEEELRQYYETYIKSLERWGSRARVEYGFPLFSALWKNFSKTDFMRLWIAEAEGRVVGGYLTFYFQGHTVPWHGAADGDYFTFGISQLLMKSMVEYSRDKGHRIFDLTMSGGLKGVEDYKKRLGTEKIFFNICENHSGLYALGKKIRSIF